MDTRRAQENNDSGGVVQLISRLRLSTKLGENAAAKKDVNDDVFFLRPTFTSPYGPTKLYLQRSLVATMLFPSLEYMYIHI
jgi:hypothetical protein